MSKDKKNNLVPRLRFPEFEKVEEWKNKRLFEVAEIITGNTPSTNEATYYDGEKMFVSPADIDDNRFITQTKTTLTELGFSKTRKIPANSVMFVCIGSTIGKVAQNKNECATNQQINSLVPFQEHSNDFLYSILEANSSIIAELAGIQAVPIINKTLFSSITLPFPQKPEQQKIGDCLSSLDEVITAESQKLDVLREHKKGLLQNLFPQEGETVPKLRFKEFENSREWVERTIEQVAKVTTGNKDTQNKVDDGEYPFFVRSQNVERIDSYSYDGEAILTSGDGVGVGKNFHYINDKFDFHQRVYCIYEFEKEVSGKFVFMYFSQHFYKRVMRMSAKNSVDSVRRSMITEMPILIPNKKEQEKIAYTLSSIDELIIAQGQKLEALQLHKKGLLQSLFPNLNEVTE